MPSETEPEPAWDGQSGFVKFIVSLVENPTARTVGRLFVSLLGWVPGFRKPIRALRSVGEIEELEREEKFEQARALRLRALRETEDSRAAPLWRSEGSDRLYRLNDYRGALDAFEHAIASLDQSPAMYGVAQADQIYYGASVAAVMVGDKAKGARYCEKFEEVVRGYQSDASLRNSEYVKRHEEGLKWLRSHLDVGHA